MGQWSGGCFREYIKTFHGNRICWDSSQVLSWLSVTGNRDRSNLFTTGWKKRNPPSLKLRRMKKKLRKRRLRDKKTEGLRDMNEVFNQEHGTGYQSAGANDLTTELSIIIVCHKGWERLQKCLNALCLFPGKNFKAEVIVVDNKSDDITIIKAKEQFPNFKFIFNEINGGFGNGCNIGARFASGEFLLFLNPDTIATESETEKLLNTAKQNPDYLIISCRQVTEKGKESIASGEFPSITNLTGFQRAIFRTWKQKEEKPEKIITFPDWVSGSP